MQVAIALDSDKAAKARIEGPTANQAVRMAQRRQELLEREQMALAAGNNDLAFNLGCDAFDLESSLIEYGFNSQTGKRVRNGR